MGTNCLPRDECLKQLEHFFANGLYNSCQATDELIKSIEAARDEALARRALALYQKHYSILERPWDHVTFMYGLGLIYMHFNAYNWAVKAFREAIYVQPSFARSRDVHTRLGLIFKATGRYALSERHFNLAINDTRPSSSPTSSRPVLEFHLAHLFEIQGKLKQAKEAYERLLQRDDLPHQLCANIQRQLGWMYFYTHIDTSSRNNSRKQNLFNHRNTLSNGGMDTALNYLDTSFRADFDPKTSYCLGRCFTNIGKFQDAFAAYRGVIDREESTADTWCSIGVLYHRQNQPTDALQAYIRSVQFDKQHKVAWTNLGILYESHNQFHDALKCYRHTLRSSSNGLDKSLQARVRFIEKQMLEIETSLCNNGQAKLSSDKLLSLEDLWNLESKTSLETSNECSNPSNTHKDPTSSHPNVKPNPPPQSNTLLKPVAQPDTPMSIDQQIDNSIEVRNHSDNNTPSAINESPLNNCANKTDTKIDLNIKPKYLSDSNSIHPSTPTSNHVGMLNDCKLEISTQGNQDFKPESMDSKDFNLNQVLTNGASKDSGISSNSSTSADCALVPSQNTNVSTDNHISAEQVIESCRNSPKPRKIDINVLTDDDRPPLSFPKAPPYPPLASDKLFRSPPSVYLETKKDLTTMKLQEFCQSNPISIIRNISSVLKLDLGLFSTKALMESNPDQQVTIISHLSQPASDSSEEASAPSWACECQRSTSSISRYAGYQVATFKESIMEERESKAGNSKTNPTKESETDSNESGSAQAKRLNSTYNNISIHQQTPSQVDADGPATNNPNANPGNGRGSAAKKFKKEPPKIKSLKAATDIDLSDGSKWRPQLHELNKLPNFVKCVSASNMLTHAGSFLAGVNTVSMSMHVPGCRLVGSMTPNNFCPININVGPGDYEWCAISSEYASTLSRLCDKNGFDLDSNNWWPQMSDLQKHNVPIFRFTQRPGDLVWVNSGTIFWAQATGWCNSIKWNVGPLSAKQYRSSSESFELNKLLFRKSEVPMVQLTWNIVININYISDLELGDSIIDVLRRSLKYCTLVKELVDQTKREIFQVSSEPGPRNARFCSLCESETFNVYFTRKSDGKTHCVECARRSDETFEGYDIKQEYGLNYLMKVYDEFIETKRKFHSRHQQEL